MTITDHLDPVIDALARCLVNDGVVGGSSDVTLDFRPPAGRASATLVLRADSRRIVVRVRSGDHEAQSKSWMREHDILAVIERTPIPAPKPLASGEFSLLDKGYSYTATSFSPGVTPQGASTKDAARLADPERKAHFALAGARMLGALHNVDWMSLGAAPRTRDYLEGQLARWSRVLDDGPLETRGIEAVTSWLTRHRPASPPDTLTHGDFGFHNLMFDLRDDTISAVLDWELAAVGNPLADLAWYEFQLGDAVPDWGNPAAFMMRGAGIPDHSHIEAAYAETCSLALTDMPYYRVFSAWKMLGIWAARWDAEGGRDDAFLAARADDVPGFVSRLRQDLS